ncbi:anaphase-promoting complex subunit 11 RING-H2 finger-domain-containing protein [Pisolithus albus]|nr:anaphase-promoting complex subunit 11 RING-H2 finger-domain-containing protein [Pisolithus albus]
MKVRVSAVAHWLWNAGKNNNSDNYAAADDDVDVCGICRIPYEGCRSTCKMPGDDCPLIWGQCNHVYHTHRLLKWLGTPMSKQQCPMDRRPWITAERKVSNNNTGNEALSSSFFSLLTHF